MVSGQKSFKLVWRCHQLLTSEMIPGAVNRSPGICLAAEENPEKPQLGNRLMKSCATSHPHKWGPLPSNEASRIAKQVMKGEGRKGRKDREGFAEKINCFVEMPAV